MAKQFGSYLRGTLGQTTFYIMNGKAYARAKSSLDKRRVMRDPRFRNSLRSAERLKNASKIGSVIYRECFPGINDRKKYNELTGEATLLLKQEYKQEDVLKKMRKKYKAKQPITAGKKIKKK